MNFFQLIRTLLGGPTPDQRGTAPLEPSHLPKPIMKQLGHNLLIGSAQSTGMERTHNEDTLFVMHGNATSMRGLPQFGLFIVADGMGGHRAGEIASSISVRRVAQRVLQDAFLKLFDVNGSAEIPALQDMMRGALQDANLAVVERVPGGGTTVTAMLLLGRQVTFGHVGDSRAYLINRHVSKVVTRDHSLVERLKELGQLTDEEAAIHPQRNVLYRAVGQGANLEVDVSTEPIPSDAYMLLCSDGLWGVIPDEEIREIIFSAHNPQIASEQLVEAANAAGGPDNITAVLVYFPPG